MTPGSRGSGDWTPSPQRKLWGRIDGDQKAPAGAVESRLGNGEGCFRATTAIRIVGARRIHASFTSARILGIVGPLTHGCAVGWVLTPLPQLRREWRRSSVWRFE